jgi:type I restriction enzyme, S subunit
VHIVRRGTTQEYVPLGELREFPISVPDSKQEMQSICDLLSTLDDKIEVNRKMNEMLEELARAIFKSWFVDFDPVKAKAEGHQPVGMDAETAGMFPDSFEDSELGKIPKGWHPIKIEDVATLNPREKLRKGEHATYLEMANMPERGSIATGAYQREFNSGTKFRNGDTLVARITPCLENGKTALVEFLDKDEVAWGSTEYIVIRSLGLLPAQYFYLLARSDQFRAYAITNMTGTSGRQRVSAQIAGQYPIVRPTAEIAEKFDVLTQPLFELISNNGRESQTLAKLRETLLPPLISGKLRIPDAEKLLAEAPV